VLSRNSASEKRHYNDEHCERDPEKQPPEIFNTLRLNTGRMERILVATAAGDQKQQWHCA
jgi:hypothetical protein